MVCARLNKSRAAYYKQMKKETHQVLEDQLLTELVMEKRCLMPRLGGKKLYTLIRPSMNDHQLHLGRDKLFAWLKRHDLLVKPKKTFTKTTQSHHRFRVYKNLIKNVPITHPDQVWVSDITYLRLRKGFCYLALITDAYSRKIIGFDVSDTLELSGCIRALKKACGSKKIQSTTHHSDRGFQYCSNKYVGLLKEHNIQISMAEAGNCYENATAERVNGILKSEFNLDATFLDLRTAQQAASQAINIYNTERPHMALKMRKPNEMYAA